MQIIHDPREMRAEALAAVRRGVRTALVPTMGALHEGHLALCREARRHGDRVAMSIFVNPAQFGPAEDLDKYPRTWESDLAGAKREGVDLIFAPRADAIYPPGFQTYVAVEGLGGPLCGAHRPVFFRGVATVVLKLFNLTQPSTAVFGWKDAQQFLVLRRMVRDLDMPIEMVGLDTVREADGLAMSSRNQYLSPAERAEAPSIYRGLSALRAAADAGERDAARLLAIARAEIERGGLFRIQYLEMRSMENLSPLERLEPGATLVALAAHIGETRLIDNIRL